MQHIYAVKTPEEFEKYREFVNKIQPKLTEYIRFLRETYQVLDLPRAIVWTDVQTATHLISDLPVPAYTNEYRVVMTPDVEAWRGIYLKQLETLPESGAVEAIRAYYQTALSENNLLQILGHELAHHSELFLDDFDSYGSGGIWFEEGMVEYISRRYFLTAEEFAAEARVNRQLVALLQGRCGGHSLEEFGAATYQGDYAGIFFEYWRSFLAVADIVERFHGSVPEVFRSYHRWNDSGRGVTLEAWFRTSR